LGALKNGVSNIVTYDRDLDYLINCLHYSDEPSLENVKTKLKNILNQINGLG